MSTPDWRLNSFRDDLAASHLKGIVTAPRFVDGVPAIVTAPSALLLRAPSYDSVVDSELLFGEQVTIYENVNGWAWVQNAADDYVGYMRSEALKLGSNEATHRVAVARTHIYPQATIKTRDCGAVSLNALAMVERQEGEFSVLADGAGFLFASHIMPIGQHEADFVAVAERFLHAPYRWGGRTSLGVDCSGLVQMALYACGIACPRDTDMQERELGSAVSDDLEQLRRGDLVFWKGHVGVVSAPGILLHATGHFMQVVAEPLQTAVARIASQGHMITAKKRI